MAPIIMSLAFEVVMARVKGEDEPPMVAGMPLCGSNGEAVFAPEIANAYMVPVVPARLAVTVIASAVSTPEDTAQYSYNIPPVLETLVRRLQDKLFASVTVGGFVVGVGTEVKKTISTSFVVPVVRVVAQEGVQAP